ncbi:MAG: UvrD-helicase domain-containing protein, partial [Ignavibacteriaceae bacterium]
MNLKSLNDQQKKAVEHDKGPSMIVAGAGSGKTRVLTYKVAYLISNGYK